MNYYNLVTALLTIAGIFVIGYSTQSNDLQLKESLCLNNFAEKSCENTFSKEFAYSTIDDYNTLSGSYYLCGTRQMVGKVFTMIDDGKPHSFSNDEINFCLNEVKNDSKE